MPNEQERKEQQFHEYELQEAVRQAVMAADRIILDASDGSTEETNWLTAEVARNFLEKALMSFNSAILRKRMGLPQ